MKRFSIFILIIGISLSACARTSTIVRSTPPPTSKTIALPKPKDGRMPESYEVNGQRYYPLPDAQGFVQYGKASWYGEGFHGRLTASGETYDMHQKTAAHKTLPLGTFVKVENLKNGKETVVRINDRGPFVKGRVIDLSFAAGKEIDLIGPGVADAKVTALGKEVKTPEKKDESKLLVEYRDPSLGEFTIQVGAFRNKENAERLAERLKVIFDYVNVAAFQDERLGTMYRVHVSKSNTLKQASEIERRLEDMGFEGAFVFRL